MDKRVYAAVAATLLLSHAESLFMKQQRLIINQSRRRAPNLTVINWMLFGFWSLFLTPTKLSGQCTLLKYPL